MPRAFPKFFLPAILVTALILGGNHCAVFAVALSGEQSSHACCEAESSVPLDCTQCCDHLAAPVPTNLSADLHILPLLVVLPVTLAIPRTVVLVAPRWESSPGRFFTDFQFDGGLGSLAPPVFVS